MYINFGCSKLNEQIEMFDMCICIYVFERDRQRLAVPYFSSLMCLVALYKDYISWPWGTCSISKELNTIEYIAYTPLLLNPFGPSFSRSLCYHILFNVYSPNQLMNRKNNNEKNAAAIVFKLWLNKIGYNGLTNVLHRPRRTSSRSLTSPPLPPTFKFGYL